MVKKLEYPEGLKTCTKCKETKSLLEFGKRKDRANQPLSKCKSCSSKASLTWNQKNKDKLSINSSIYYFRNKDKILNKIDRSRKKAYDLVYKKAHLDRDATRSSKRRAFKIQAFPAFAKIEYIALFFKISALEYVETGIKHHVDHIIPLKSKYVCGLHYEHNLQVLTAKENIEKHNSYWPDMPDTNDKDLIKLSREFYAKTF